jgi:hypothetical protein
VLTLLGDFTVLTLYGKRNLITSFYSLITHMNSSFSVPLFESSVSAFELSNLINIKIWPYGYSPRPDRENSKTICKLVRNFEITIVKVLPNYCDSFA